MSRIQSLARGLNTLKLCGQSHKAIGSIGISGPATRLTPKRLSALAAMMVEIGKALLAHMAFTH